MRLSTSLARFAAVAVFFAFSVAAPAQGFSITSLLDGGTSSVGDGFLITEVVEFSLTGAQPFRQFVLAYGDPDASPTAFPSIQGSLGIELASLQLIGVFATNASGEFSFQALIPRGFPLGNRVVQALVSQDPFGPGASGAAWRFFPVANFVVEQPATGPTVTEVLNVGPGATPANPGPCGVAPAILTEGTAVQLLIRGSFFASATAVPDVAFAPLSPCADPLASAFATSVALVDDPCQVGAKALLVTAPALIGNATAAPDSNAGPLEVFVDYSLTGLFPVTPANGVASTGTIVTAASPILRSNLVPAIAVDGLSPMANLAVGGCTITVTGSDFLTCAEVFFNLGGTVLPGANVNVQNATTITVDPPAHASGLASVIVVNPDAVASAGAPFAYFVDVVNQITVVSATIGGLSPASLVENTGGAAVTATVSCPFVGPSGSEYSALDPRSGTDAVGEIALALGSNLAGTDAFVALTPTNVTVTAPGTVEIVFVAPSLPPGLLVPTTVSTNGSTNTGPKYLQVFAPPCLNPAASPHAALSAIPSTEPGNSVTYTAAAAPTILAIAPAACGRVDGGQDFVITGMDFLTNDPTVPSVNAALAARVLLSGAGITMSTPFEFVSFDGPTQITVRTPDLTALVAAPPVALAYEVVNPDGLASAALPFGVAPSLAVAAQDVPIAFVTGTVNDIVTTPGGLPIVFNHLGDLTLPATTTLRASGDAPLIIRCRGNVIIEGTIDLSGASYDVLAPSPTGFAYPAGGAMGGLGYAEDPVQPAFVGAGGFSPLDGSIQPLPLPYPGAGGGGAHLGVGRGGGGGGMRFMGFDGDPVGDGGIGGLSYSLISLPIPGLPATLPPALNAYLEFLLPAGGSGGGAGGLGIDFPPFDAFSPPAALAPNGRGGNGGGAVLIAADGTITINGLIDVSGQTGFPGGVANGVTGLLIGAGGGAGSGGGILLQALQGITVGASGSLLATGGTGGVAGGPGGFNGGNGSEGMIRLALPAVCPITSTISGTVVPAADPSGQF